MITSMRPETVIIVLSILGGLLLLSAFFSASETAMLSLNRYRIKNLANNGSHFARITLWLTHDMGRLLSVILMGNNFVNIAASALTTRLGYEMYGDMGVLVSTICLTLFLLFFCEIVPKTIASNYPEKVARISCDILYIMTKLLTPVLKLTDMLTVATVRIFSGKKNNPQSSKTLTTGDLRMVLGDQETLLPQAYREMLLSILDLENKDVEEVIVPARHIVGINLNDPFDSIRKLILKSNHSYFPVYTGDLNATEGFLSMKDALQLFVINSGNDYSFDKLKSSLRTASFIPETTDLYQQLTFFLKSSDSFPVALVVDEYGEVTGMVSFNNIVHEIVGHLRTFSVSNSIGYIENSDQGNKTYILFGSASLSDINKRFGLDFPTDGPRTLNGFIMEIIETFPRGQFCLMAGSWRIEVLSIKNNAVNKVKLKKV